jgi:hypothetical protein
MLTAFPEQMNVFHSSSLKMAPRPPNAHGEHRATDRTRNAAQHTGGRSRAQEMVRSGDGQCGAGGRPSDRGTRNGRGAGVCETGTQQRERHTERQRHKKRQGCGCVRERNTAERETPSDRGTRDGRGAGVRGRGQARRRTLPFLALPFLALPFDLPLSDRGVRLARKDARWPTHCCGNTAVKG